MKKLQLKKEVIEALNNFEQMRIKGGDVPEAGDALTVSVIMACLTAQGSKCIDPGYPEGPGIPKTNANMITCRGYPGTESCGVGGGGSDLDRLTIYRID